jgi:hypothetical protein
MVIISGFHGLDDFIDWIVYGTQRADPASKADSLPTRRAISVNGRRQ